ncbi:MAG: glycoside hydrolase family 43 protein [Saprospiraceae bacterium]|nr:glycoside hydrolase family 43 protein [Saprospiraceae bacterium]
MNSLLSILVHKFCQMVRIIPFLIFITDGLWSQKPVYLFSYFKGNGEDGLHLATSKDGLQWTSLNNDQSFLIPVTGKDKLMRDPCIIQDKKGTFQMVWTVSWNEKGIGYASSKDLIHWTNQQYLPVMEQEAEARNCWAPEITYDPKNKTYMIYWATTIPGRFPLTESNKENKYNHRMYYTTTSDFIHFSKTALLYDHGFNVIDATIVPVDNKYVMFLKDETSDPPQKNIRTAISYELTGPYTLPSKPITGEYWAEGPTAIKIKKYWYVYFDKYRDHQYGAVRSIDLLHWEDVSDQVYFPAGVRHGTVFKVSVRFVESLKSQIN